MHGETLKLVTNIFIVYSYMFRLMSYLHARTIFVCKPEDDSCESKHVAVNYKYNCC